MKSLCNNIGELHNYSNDDNLEIKIMYTLPLNELLSMLYRRFRYVLTE